MSLYGNDLLDDWNDQGAYTLTDMGEVFFLEVPADEENDLDPVLVIHGYPTCSYDWRHVIPALARRRHVVAVDLPGFGLSEKPDMRYSVRGYADAVETVVTLLGLPSVALDHPRHGQHGRGRVTGARSRRGAGVRRLRAGPDQRQHLHRDGPAHRRPAVPPVRRPTRGWRASKRPGSRLRSRPSARPTTNPRPTISPPCGRSWLTTTATRCWRGRSGTSRIAGQRRRGSPARSSGTRRRSAWCGARSTRSPSTR